MKTLLSIIFVIILTESNCQVIKDKNQIKENDIYNNYDNSKNNVALPFRITDKLSNKIIFERTFKGNLCKECYDDLIVIAEKYKNKKQIEDAIGIYKVAFRLNGNLGKVKDRYNAAICFSKLGQKDSAFFQLDKIANGGKYNNLDEIESEKDFRDLHKDSRWIAITDRIKKNIQEFTEQLNSTIDGNLK
jgi:tetratricopeptide (TPR) repeat protein